MKNNKLKVAIYCRSANNDPITIEEQENRLKGYCSAMNYEIVKIYKDIGYSGTNNQRPQYQQMLKDLKKDKFNKIIIFDISRLCRSIIEFEKIISLLKECNCNLFSISEEMDLTTSIGLFFIKTLNLFNELERRYT